MNYEEMFDQSYERVKGICIDGKSFFTAFYDNFLTLSPVAAEHFAHVDMERQVQMMEKSFYGLFIFYATQNANDYLESIALQHGKPGLGITQALFDVWMDALIITVKKYDTHYSSDVALSWRIVLSPGITYMKHRFVE